MIQFGFKAVDKNDALNKLTDMLVEKKIITTKDEFLNALLEREKLSTTGVCLGISIPAANAMCFENGMIIFC